MDVRTPIASNYGDHIDRFGEIWSAQIEKAKQKFGSKLEEVLFPKEAATDVPILIFKKETIVDALKFFKEESGLEYGFLSDITATDETPEKPRFFVVYNLLSQQKMNRIRLKVRVEEGETVPTAVDVWPGANWAEREVFDMFGIKFKDHPDLRRILMDERWQGYPLRKDYPLKGYQIFSTPQEVRPELLEDKQ